MSSTPQHQDEAGLDRALQNVTESLGKTDGKAALLFGAETALAALARSALSDGPTAARVTAGVAVGFLAVAIVFVVLAVLPRLGDDGTSFLHWSKLSPEEIREAVREDVRSNQVGVLSRLAKVKFRHLQAACVTTGAAACMLMANLLASVGRWRHWLPVCASSRGERLPPCSDHRRDQVPSSPIRCGRRCHSMV
ncbi:Pycsar system effector family protein [Streptomyces ehimensis]|uniref:Pycsar system effector family protein n=1 Tax=Streptomyces ehimensis TaxID=68195 RepID=A0ABV9BC20_9ACTN